MNYKNTLYERKKANMENNRQIQHQTIETFFKEKFGGRFFVGSYQERRYVEPIKNYRDVVVVNNLEFDFIRDLEILKQLIHNSSFASLWIGITGPNPIGAPVGNCLWVNLKDVVPGLYWFRVKSIRILQNEILFYLKCIRPAQAETSMGSNTQKNQEFKNPDNNPLDWSSNLLHTLEFVSDNIVSLCTFSNFKSSVRFLFAFIGLCFIGILKLTRELGDFALKLFREFSIFIHVTTPIFLKVIEFFTKCVGGFYLLILAMWRSRGDRSPPPNFRYQQISYHRPY